MKNELFLVALFLIAIHFVFGYMGALLTNAMLRRRANRSLPALTVFGCGLLGALAAVALVLTALPYMFGLVIAPLAGGVLVYLLSKRGA